MIASRREADIGHQGDLTEIDPDEYKSVRKVTLFFLKDYLVIATDDSVRLVEFYNFVFLFSIFVFISAIRKSPLSSR